MHQAGTYGRSLLPHIWRRRQPRTRAGSWSLDADCLPDRLKQAEAASRTRKLSATIGGGSITNADQLLAAGVTKLIHSLPGVGGYASRLGDLNRVAVEQHMARLLQSPGELSDALRARPPDRLNAVYAQVQRASGVGAAAEAATP